jgi:hypothetical protein
MFFDNLPLEITCSKCGKQIKETVKWLKAESQKCPFCGTLIDTTEFRRGIDEGYKSHSRNASEPSGEPWEHQDKNQALITKSSGTNLS